MAPTPWPARDAEHLLVSGAQMAALEQQLFASGLPVEALMEKAALAVVQRLRQPDWWPLLQRHGALVLVGPGHNGGDGLVVARELHLGGIAVRIWCPFERLKPLTAGHRRHGQWLGIAQQEQQPDPADAAVWIDALFGIGQSRPPGEPIETLLEQRQQQQPQRLIAIDGPTGLCASSGRPLGRGVATAGLSLSIGLLKQGFLQDAALRWLGQLERLDLALPPALLETLPAEQPLALGPSDLAAAPWPRASDPALGKYGRGRLLVIAGSDAYRGAAHLALAGARASGCGSLRAALPQTLAEHLWQPFPEVVLGGPLASGASGALELTTLQPSQLERLDALLLGPGLGPEGHDGDAWDLLQGFSGLLVLDADGLNRLQGSGEWLRQRRGPTWITPHRGEFNRLFPALSDADPPIAAAAAAETSGAAVLLKGARSVIAAPDGRSWQLRQACSQAARAGLGDVLAGYAAGLGARQRAMAGESGAGDPTAATTLALAALAHACAAERACHQGDGHPAGVARALQQLTAAEELNLCCFCNTKLKGY